MSVWFANLGRFREAEPFYRRGMELDTLSPAKALTAVFALAGVGRIEAAWALAKRTLVLYPNRPSVPGGYVVIAALYEPPETALEAIDTVERMGGVFRDGSAQAWRDYVNGARRGRVDRALLARFKAAALNGDIDSSDAAVGLAQAGDIDDAFDLFNKALDGHRRIFLADMFVKAVAPMRIDPRYEGLLSRVGVLQYWRKTGIGADFCGEPAAPAVCSGLTTKPVG
jgi:tetratricopeptide (TPR) repeat protein